MKKITLVSLASFVFLLMSSAVAVLTKRILTDAVLSLIIGVAILLISALIALLVREKTEVNILCFVISSVAMGILLRAWYINRGFDNGFDVMLLVSLAAVLYIWIFFALTKLPFVKGSKRAYIALAIIYLLVSAALYILVVLTTKTTYVSTFGYYMVIELAFIFAMATESENADELIRNLTLSTYSIFGVAIAVAVFIVIAAAGGDCDCDCDGDCVECCDCIEPLSERKNKKSKK